MLVLFLSHFDGCCCCDFGSLLSLSFTTNLLCLNLNVILQFSGSDIGGWRRMRTACRTCRVAPYRTSGWMEETIWLLGLGCASSWGVAARLRDFRDSGREFCLCGSTVKVVACALTVDGGCL